MDNQEKFFKALGQRVKEVRRRCGYSQEDMIYFGFSVRHWQQVEAGMNVELRTLLRICQAFRIEMHKLVKGLDKDFYRGKPEIVVPVKRRNKKSAT